MKLCENTLTVRSERSRASGEVEEQARYESVAFDFTPLCSGRTVKTPQRVRKCTNLVWFDLAYTLSGGTVFLIGVVWLHVLVGPLAFTEGGALAALGPEDRHSLIAIFAMLIAGLGVKAALVPLHGWLPVAMVAPAPVSALLHAVAVVVACITVGVAVVGAFSTIGGLVHLVYQGIMKITLFFCAGNLAETLGIHRVSEMRRVGHRIPWTMAAFTVGAFGMIGVPPLAGFISKGRLGIDGVESGQFWVVGVLAASSLLNGAYFLPILHAAWFCQPTGEWHVEHPSGRFEVDWRLLAPAVLTAMLVVLTGVLANAKVSLLAWAKFIAAREYRPRVWNTPSHNGLPCCLDC